jgi:HEAT repeat protein
MRTALSLAIGVIIAGAALAQVSVTGAPGASLGALEGTPTMVTVTLRSGGRDANLQVLEVAPEYVSFKTSEGRRRSYRIRDIRNIHVQDGVIAERTVDIIERGGLTPEHQQVVDRAVSRSYELFHAARDIQVVRMFAAAMVAIGGDPSQQEEATDYLMTLYGSNDMVTALNAAQILYIAGRTDLDTRVIQNGLDSGNRQVRALAARAAGLLGYMGDGVQLNRMAQDRSADLSVPAVVALAWMGDRAIIPMLVDNLDSNSNAVGDAAVFGLSALGGPDIIEQMKLKLRNAKSITRYRTARVLYNLGDPEGRRILKDEVLKEPSLTVDAAMLLARNGDLPAMQILQERLARRYDEDVDSLILRANMAAALVKGDDRSKITTLQELLRRDNLRAQIYVLELLPDIGLRTLITIVAPSVESGNPLLNVAGCQAAVLLAHPQARNRWLKNRAMETDWVASESNVGAGLRP